MIPFYNELRIQLVSIIITMTHVTIFMTICHYLLIYRGTRKNRLRKHYRSWAAALAWGSHNINYSYYPAGNAWW